MPKQSIKTKEKIFETATRLFEENGYKNTTVEQIIDEVGCSKGTFYYHFSGKEEMVTPLTKFMDRKIEEWIKKVPENTPAVEKLYLLAGMIYDHTEKEFEVETLAAVYAYQIGSKCDRSFDSPSRVHNTAIRSIIREGQQDGTIRNDISFIELNKMYNVVLRGVMYDWCISFGTYSLKEMGMRAMKMFLPQFLSENRDMERER